MFTLAEVRQSRMLPGCKLTLQLTKQENRPGTFRALRAAGWAVLNCRGVDGRTVDLEKLPQATSARKGA